MNSVAAARPAGRGTVRRVDARGRRRLDAAAAVLAAIYVLSVGLTDGGYYGRAYTELTTLLVAAALFALLGGLRPRLSRAGAATLAAMALLTAWIAASSGWAHDGAAVGLEIRRSVLYLAALVAALVVMAGRRQLPFLAGLLGAILLVGGIAIGMRVVSGAPVDRLYGTLLEEPVGYPNALGVLVAMGVVLAIGVASTLGGTPARVAGGVAPFLVFVLGLSGSRGGALALVLGLAALTFLAPSQSRRAIVSVTAWALAIGGAAWAFVQWHELGGATLLALSTATLAAGWLTTRRLLGTRAVLLLATVALVGTVVLLALRPPAAATSYRSDYWRAALAEAVEQPLLGSGAGSFHLSWLEHRNVELTVRDAHSLYLETLSELGVVGFALVLVLIGAPLAVAIRRRGDPLAATAGAGFVVYAAHAGMDWDWEMPVVTLAGLALAAVLVAGEGDRAEIRHRRTGRDTRWS